MSKKISCTYCNKFLGQIRDAKLRKNIYHICKECRQVVSKTTQQGSADLPEGFDALFGGFK